MARTNSHINFLLTGPMALKKKKKADSISGAGNVKHVLEAFYHATNQGNYKIIYIRKQKPT